MKSTSSASRTAASAKWPMRTLAITGMLTVFIISQMIFGEAMRATPPSLRMSDGTRSRAMTAHAPAFSAMPACSAFVTSMITPPLSISARPTFTRHWSFEYLPLLPCVAVICVSSARFCCGLIGNGLPDVLPGHILFAVNDDEAPLATREHIPCPVSNFTLMIQLAAFAARDKSLDDDLLACVILFERKLHAARVCATAAKAPVFRLGIKFHLAPGFPFLARTRSTGFSLRSLDLASPNCSQTEVCATKTSPSKS